MTSDALTLVVGEALIDIVVAPDGARHEHVGGGPANIALGLARLDVPAALATHFGADPRGLRIGAHLQHDSVLLVDGSAGADATSTATAHLDDRGVATYDFDVAWDLPAEMEAAVDALAPGHLHVGSLGTALLPGADRVRRLVERARGQATISYDPNLRPALLRTADEERPGVEQLVAQSDLVKASDEDLAWLYPGAAVDEILARWTGVGASVAIVTLGSEGARALIGAEFVSVPPQRVDVVDTVGAGDSFMAALISGLLDAGLLGGETARHALRNAQPGAVRPALDRAIRVAAITCSRAGADPPYRREL